jgi:lipopolysaccharide/colanic/teichoic acid biosynthesis glycosyltransferase
LRRTSLDELPNLWYVVRGDISLVGPRPEIPELLGCYNAEQMEMFRVKTGVTRLAQTGGRDRLTVEQTIALDCEYARRASLVLDIVILIRTVKQVLTREAAP